MPDSVASLSLVGRAPVFLFVDEGLNEVGRRGTGLGLVSVTERVRLTGGTVSISSEARRGTQVQVWIPLEARAAQAQETVSRQGARIA
jgi:signal transduction histidine kinase